MASLNAFNCISLMNWGADGEVLLYLYIALKRCKMDYRLAVYSSARKSSLRKLDPMHNAGLRCYATVTFTLTQHKAEVRNVKQILR